MVINLEIPEDIEQDIQGLDNAILYRQLMEVTAVEAYRQRKIGTAGTRLDAAVSNFRCPALFGHFVRINFGEYAQCGSCGTRQTLS